MTTTEVPNPQLEAAMAEAMYVGPNPIRRQRRGRRMVVAAVVVVVAAVSAVLVTSSRGGAGTPETPLAQAASSSEPATFANPFIATYVARGVGGESLYDVTYRLDFKSTGDWSLEVLAKGDPAYGPPVGERRGISGGRMTISDVGSDGSRVVTRDQASGPISPADWVQPGRFDAAAVKGRPGWSYEARDDGSAHITEASDIPCAASGPKPLRCDAVEKSKHDVTTYEVGSDGVPRSVSETVDGVVVHDIRVTDFKSA
jgi:hypothetical protein